MNEKSGSEEHGDAVIDKALETATNGLSSKEAAIAIKDAVDGLKTLARRFKEEGAEAIKPADIPRSMAYLL